MHRAFLALLCLVIGTLSGHAQDRPALKPVYNGIYTNEKVVALTFDDGPHGTLTPRLLDILAKRNVKATFYVVGRNVVEYPAIVRRIVEEGHEIANHSWSHPKLSSMSDAAVHAELKKTHDAIVAACGVAPRNFRPPYGAFTKRQQEWALKEFGYPSILWSVDPLDWRRPGSAVVARRLLEGAKPGGILLVHDIHAGTVDAIPAVLEGLLAQGYRFVTVGDLLPMDQPRPTPPPKAPKASPTSSPAVPSAPAKSPEGQ